MTQNNNLNIVGITGFKRSGKDTAGSILIQNGYIKYSFAGPLKKACQEIFMFDYEQTEGCKKEDLDNRWSTTPRKVFQRFGTEIFRNNLKLILPEVKDLNENFWIYRFKLWYQEQIKTNPNLKVVVTDVRFPNEADIIKELGGTIIKVIRSETNLNNDQHSSEVSITKIKPDFTIYNNSTIHEYHSQIKKIFNL